AALGLWIAPLARQGLRLADAAEVSRARVVADDRVGEDGVTSPLQAAAQLHVGRETGDARGRSGVAEDARVAEPRLELSPAREEAGFDVERAVGGRERRQEDAQHD